MVFISCINIKPTKIMAVLHFAWLFVANFIVNSVQKGLEDSTGRNLNVLTECGQTLTANSGKIDYKLNQNYEAGELCVFILRNNISTNPGFRFLLESHEIGVYDKNSLTIFTLEPNLSWSDDITIDTGNLGPPYLDPQINLAGTVAVVIFKPRTSSGSGFKLSFEATGNPDSVPGHNIGLNYVSNGEQNVSYAYEALSNCTAPSCADVLAITFGKRLITDPAVFLKLSLTLNPLSNGTYDETCFNIFPVQEQPITYKPGMSGCWNDYGGTRQYDFDTRGMYIVIVSYIPGSKASGELSWGKVADTENELA